MATGLSKQSGHLPFINQSIARTLRGGAFRTKNQLGPQTAQAITEGALEVDSRRASEQALQHSQMANQAEMQEERLAESRRQASANDQLMRERMAQDQQRADRQAAQAYETQQAEEQTFWDGAFGS